MLVEGHKRGRGERGKPCVLLYHCAEVIKGQKADNSRKATLHCLLTLSYWNSFLLARIYGCLTEAQVLVGRLAGLYKVP